MLPENQRARLLALKIVSTLIFCDLLKFVSSQRKEQLTEF